VDRRVESQTDGRSYRLVSGGPQASWTVPARVVRNGDGAEFMITFFQPPGFTDAFFDEQIALVDVELAKLRELLEAPASSRRPAA
jgi:hypothetical protein